MAIDILNPSNVTTVSETHSLKKAVICEVEAYFAKHGVRGAIYHHIVQQMEEGLISAVMAFTENNEAKTSRLMGISRSTLRQRLVLLNYYEKSKEVD